MSSVVSTGIHGREAALANVVVGMRQSLGVVMGWQGADLPPRFVPGGGDMRRLTIRVREQPVNFLIAVHQSLETAREGQGISRRGSKASRVLLGEENHPERVKNQFVETTVEEIKQSASALKNHTNEIYKQFRSLRTTLLDIHKELEKVTSKEQKSAFLARLARHLSKDFRHSEDVLQKVHDDLEEIEKTLRQITHWWQKVESEANYLRMNGESSLARENVITMREIKDSFTTLETYFEDYVKKMGELYDENIVILNPDSRRNVMEVQERSRVSTSERG